MRAIGCPGHGERSCMLCDWQWGFPREYLLSASNDARVPRPKHHDTEPAITIPDKSMERTRS